MFNTSFMGRVLKGLGVLAASFVVASGAQAQQPNTFVEVSPPQATATQDKIEVLEFFQYGCPHCRAMEPLIETWEKQQSDDVQLQRVPVAFNAGMAPWQRLYYSLEGLGRLDLHSAVFNTVQTERNPLNSRDRAVEWAVKQGLDRAKFEAMYDSFGVGTKVSRANQLIKSYKLESVPTMVVNGRYMTSPALAGGYPQTLEVASQLLQKVRGGK
jgi:thiol:disulfide interchange protein DsbA